MRRLRYALWPAGLAFGVAAESIGKPELIVVDGAAGFALVFLGLAAWSLRGQTRVGPIMAIAGFAWFLGTLWTPAVFLHRGPLAHLLLSYPRGRVTSRLDQAGVGGAYAYAAVYPIAENDAATIAFALALVALSTRRYIVSGGLERRARLASLTATAAFGLILVLGAAARLASVSNDRAALFAYDLTVGLIAVGLFADLLWGRWAQAAVTDLVIDLGAPEAAGTLRDRLARALGDPTLVVGYWLPEQGRYVDEAGRPLELATGMERVVTPIEDDGRRVAVLVHDATVLEDPALTAAVGSATKLAVSNARLQAEVRARVVEVEASRRRIVEAADAQRRRLRLELREGAERRLTQIAELLADAPKPLEEVRAGLGAARAELREFARGIHPATLTEHGLAAALEELGRRSPVRVTLEAPPERFPPEVEAAAYFVCSEALANAAKYADASRVAVRVQRDGRKLIVSVEDDGVGGADPSLGTGLRGLTDRVEALGGQLDLESPPAHGTRLVAVLPAGD